MDIAGDPLKQPPECMSRFVEFDETNPRRAWSPQYAEGYWTRCPNLKDVGDPLDMDGETHGCSVCGKRYRLYYDEMR